MSHRIDKVRSTLARAVREVIARGLNDPRATGMISVTDLTVSPDLRNATVLVSIFPEDRTKLTMHALESAARHIRREVGELVALNQVPALIFRLDTSLKRQAEVFNALGKAHDSLNRPKPDDQAETPDAPQPGESGESEERGS